MAFEQGQCSGRERRLIATVHAVRNAALKATVNENTDLLQDENRRLKEQIARMESDCSHHRVLIAATSDQTIEVYADPKVRLAVINIPDTRSNEDLEKAIEWALDKVPYEFRGMPWEEIQPKVFSTRCMNKTEFRYYRDQVLALEYLTRVGQVVEQVTTEKK